MSNGNMITNKGKLIALHRLMTVSPSYTIPSKFEIGTGTDTPALTDTSLTSHQVISNAGRVSFCDATTGWTGNTDTAISLNTTTYHEGTGALNVTKSGNTITYAECYNDSTTPVVFTGKYLGCWVYVKDAAMLAKLTSVYIRFGTQQSPSSKYYSWNVTSQITTGWNWVHDLTIASGTTVGSPDPSDCHYFHLYINVPATSTTWSAGDLILDDIMVYDYDKVFTSLTLDETNRYATFKATLNSTEANTTFTEIGFYNTDSTNKLYSRSAFTSITKDESRIYHFYQVDWIE